MSYFLLLAGKILLALFTAVLCLRVVLLFIKCSKGYLPIDIGNAFRPSQVRKGTVAVFFLLFLGLTMAVIVENDRQTGGYLVALAYPQASSGLNPNGSRYNMSDILCDEVLERAVVFGGFEGINAEKLKEGLSVEPVSVAVKGDEEEESDGLVSTQFHVRFKSNYKTGGLNGDEVAYAVVQSYKNWFVEQFSENMDVLRISFDDIEEYDYPDLKRYFSTHLNKLCNFTRSYTYKDSAFVSNLTGESFISLNTKGWQLINTALENLDSYVVSYGLSRERDNYMSRLRYEHIKECNSYLRNMQSYDVRIDAINRYDNDMATVVYIPTYDTDNTFYMSKTKIGIDHFSTDADNYSENASNSLDTILDQKYLLQQLHQGSGTVGNYRNLDAMVNNVESQILKLAEITRETVQDYEDSTSNGYVIVTEPEKNLALYILEAIASGMFVFFLLYCNKALAGLYRKLGAKRVG